MTAPHGGSPSTAVVIAVGSELLTPYKTDTNSLYIVEQLGGIGIPVTQKMIVGDDPERLAGALRYAMVLADVVVVTGGLGPTEDDVTRDVAAELLGLPLEESADILHGIRRRFAARGLEMPETNRRQAAVPRGARVLPNRAGTAPGLAIEAGKTLLVLLPGPPRELQPMFDRFIADGLAPASGGRRVQRRTVRTTGRPESHIDELAAPLYGPWRARRPPIEATVLASLGQVDLHLSTVGDDPDGAARTLDEAVAEVMQVLGSAVVSTDGRSLPVVVGELLLRSGARLAVAESCTGGLITSRLTDVPGSSAYVHAGWTVYSNEAKTTLLGVPADLIEEHGAVSEAVVEAMARAARDRAAVDYGLAVSGIAGPGGATPGKPVGTICLALVGRAEPSRVRRVRFPGDRERVKFQASQSALDLLRRTLLRSAAATVTV